MKKAVLRALLKERREVLTEDRGNIPLKEKVSKKVFKKANKKEEE